MKLNCIVCQEPNHARLIDPCPYCGEHVCDECWPDHEDCCLAEDHEPDVDIFGMNYSDADPGL